MIISSISAFFYITLCVEILAKLFNKFIVSSFILVLTAGVAVLSHGYSLYALFDGDSGQNFGLFNALSLVIWVCMIILLAGIQKKNSESLLLIMTPIALVSVLLAHLFPSTQIIDLSVSPVQLIHIISAITAYSLLTLAAIQALMMGILENKLRKHPGQISPLLPPMQTMDHFLFQLITVGFALLTLSMFEAFIYLWEQTKSQPLHKLILSVGAWIVFGTLLIGRFRFGWRGKTAVRWTLSGVVLLLLGYFGSKFVLEFILQRP